MEQCTQRPPKVLSNESWQVSRWLLSPIQEIHEI